MRQKSNENPPSDRGVIPAEFPNLKSERQDWLAMGYRWIVKCKHCGADITFYIVDEHPRATVNNMPSVSPPKPVMRNRSEALKCSLCKVIADYTRQDLQFRSA